MEKKWKINGIDFDSKPTYGNDDKYIKIKIKKYEDSITTNVCNKKESKKIPEEKIPHKCLSIMFINNNFRFCSLCIWKVSSPNIFRRM